MSCPQVITAVLVQESSCPRIYDSEWVDCQDENQRGRRFCMLDRRFFGGFSAFLPSVRREPAGKRAQFDR